MRTLLVYRNGRFVTEMDHSQLGLALTDPHSTIWLDIDGPTDEDVAYLRDQCRFHPLAIEDAVRSHERPKIDAYGPAAVMRLSGGNGEPVGAGSYYFVVFYNARYQPSEDHIESGAVNLFIGANFLVTVHYGEISDIEDVRARWQAPDSPLEHQVGALVHALLDALVDDYFPLMDQIADRVEDLEDSIFSHFSESAIQSIFRLKKDLLSLRRVVAPERDVLNVLLRRQLPIFRPEDVAYLQDVYDHLVRVTDNIDTYRDLLSSALDSFLSLQSNNLNQVMKLLTMASIVLMTDALIAGIYGMNFKFMPELNWPFGYAWALALMAMSTLALVSYFRLRKWF